MDRANTTTTSMYLTRSGLGRRALARAAGSAVAGLAAAPLLGAAARQDSPATITDHPAIVALSAVLADAAAASGAPVEDIAVQSLEAMDWPDACLGLPEEGQVCAEAITPGFVIVLITPDGPITYHTDQHGAFRRKTGTGETEALRVLYEMTGGIDGRHEEFTLETSEMPDAEAAELRRLIDEADFWRLPEQLDDHAGISDGFWYRVTVSDGTRRHSVSLIDTLGPDETSYPRFWALLVWLDQHTAPATATEVETV